MITQNIEKGITSSFSNKSFIELKYHQLLVKKSMTRKKPRRLDKIRSGIEAVDKVAVDRGDLHDQRKIQELENQMDNELFDGKKNLGIDNPRNLNKKMKKSHKGLR